MFITNVFFHACDAMQKIVFLKNNPWSYLVVRGCLTHGVAQDALHTLDSLDVDHGNEIVDHKNSSKMCVLVIRKSKHLIFVTTFFSRKHGLLN
jgi:hypothetical protein